jgi:hypothetical protein
MRRLTTWIVVLLAVALVLGGFYLWWSLDLRWRPHLVTRNQPQIAGLLDGAGWVSPTTGGSRLYVIAYRDCAPCQSFLASQLSALEGAGVQPRIIVVARPDQNGLQRSTPAERSTVAELWLNRNWALYQAWRAAPTAAWTAPGITPADGDAARTAVVGAGRDLIERLGPLLGDNGVRFDYPTLVWWTPKGQMQACACVDTRSWPPVRKALGAR